MIWRLKNALGKVEFWYRKQVVDKIKEICEYKCSDKECIGCTVVKDCHEGKLHKILQFIKDIENGIQKGEK